MKERRPIVITGFMGCGKSKIALALAQRRKVAVVDLDETITAQEGRTPAELITQDGEAAFRTIETRVLRQVFESGADGIIALGGGAWIQQANRDLCDQHHGVSVWLDLPFSVCWERISSSTEDRPLGKTREQSHALYDRRKPIYELAKVHVAITDDDPIDHLITRIEAALDQVLESSQ